jgi:uncharacterized protein (TIGR03084 family)
MRQRLLDATVECLVERGFAGTSTTLVSERAGVSRGAQLHHFPTKNDLVLAAVEHLSEQRGVELQRAADGLPRGAQRTRAILEMLGDHFASPVFNARSSCGWRLAPMRQLRAAVEPLEQKVGRETHRLTVELLGADETQPGVRELVQATLDLVRGLGLANTIGDDRARVAASCAVGPTCSTPDWGRHERPAGRGAARPRRRGRPSGGASWPTSTTTAGGRDTRRRVGRGCAGRHLAWTDEVAVLAATDKEKWDEVVMLAIGDPDGFAGTAALAGAAADPGEILGRWRAARASLQETLRAFPAGRKLPWFGPPMSPTSMATARFMETWAHSLDVAEALGCPRSRTTGSATWPTSGCAPATSRSGARARAAGRGVRVTLVSPSEESGRGARRTPPDGQPARRNDFCLLVTRRRHRADTDLSPSAPTPTAGSTSPMRSRDAG